MCLWALALAPAAVAQTHWSLRGGDARVRLAGPVATWLQGPVAASDPLPAGDYAVHFGVDAVGKPRSLAFAVADGAHVRLAAAPAPRAVAEGVGGDEPGASYRVAATTPPGSDGTLGLVARRAEDSEVHFVWDRGEGEFRLEVLAVGRTRVLARAVAPTGDEELHTMALQVEGFRIDAFFDEAPVLRAMSGGLSPGGVGAFTADTLAAFAMVERQPVARPRASVALVVEPGRATLHGAVTVTPGHWHVLELSLDRPHPPLPLDEAGLEPWLLRGPAAPIVLTADWRDSYGPGGIGRIDADGTFSSRLQWPSFAALRRQCALVRALLVSPRGEVVAERTPAVPLCIP